MTQHPQGHEAAGDDEQLAAWLKQHQHDIVTRIQRVRQQVDELHATHSDESWWSAVKPAFRTIPQPAAEAVAHLTAIGRTDVPVFRVLESIVIEAQADEIQFTDRAAGRWPDRPGDRTLYEAVTMLLESWWAMLYGH